MSQFGKGFRFLTRLRRQSWPDDFRGDTQHAIDKALLRFIGNVAGAHHVPVAHDGDAVAMAQNMIEEMADVNDRHTTIFQPRDQLMQALGLVFRQRRCWFVHDDDARVTGNRPHYFHLLPVGNPKIGHLRMWIKAKATGLLQYGKALGVAPDQKPGAIAFQT